MVIVVHEAVEALEVTVLTGQPLLLTLLPDHREQNRAHVELSDDDNFNHTKQASLSKEKFRRHKDKNFAS